MKIAIDLDEVLSDTMTSLIAFHNRIFNTTLQKSNFHSYEWWRVWGGTREQSVAKFFQFIESFDFLNSLPVPGSVEGVKELGREHSLTVITSRQAELEEKTKQWLNKHFPKAFDDVYVINHPQWARSGETRTKVQICRLINADVLIEDSLDYARECDHLPVILLDYPWNQGPLPPNTKRVHSWEGIVNEVKKLENKDEF